MKSTFKSVIIFATLVISGCVGSTDEPAENFNSGTALDSASTPVSREMLDRARNDPEFTRVQDQLAHDGYSVSFDDAVALSFNEYIGAFFPVTREASDVSNYRGIVYQYKDDEKPLVALELGDGQSTDMDEGIDWAAAQNAQTQGYTCGAWGQWYTISTYCENNVMCWGYPATMLVRRQDRTCCATSCWTESQYTTVRNKCGC